MRQLLVTLALLACGSPVLAEDTPRPPPLGPNAPPDFFLAYAEESSLVRVVPLVGGRLPDLTKGDELRPTWGPGAATAKPPTLALLQDGDLLVVVGGGVEFVRYRRDGLDAWKVRARGELPPNGGLVGLRDVDGDREPDVVLVAPRASGAAWAVRVARGRDDGTFAPPGPPREVVGPMYSVFLALGDVDEDGVLDLLLHEVPHGAIVPVRLFAARGAGGGTWGEMRGLAGGKHGASTIAVAKLRPEEGPSVLLGSDDDTDDVGQTQLALRRPDGRWDVVDGADLEPTREGWSSDEGAWTLTPVDVDLDGHVDLVARFDAWSPTDAPRRTIVQVLAGRPEGGGFRTAETILDRDFPRLCSPAIAWPAAPHGP